jgi:hypothetical protein
MKVFKKLSSAIQSMDSKQPFYLNSICPYTTGDDLCGNWCALFYLDFGGENTTPYIILGCKAGEKYLYVEKIVED